jgi:hypothetical protein
MSFHTTTRVPVDDAYAALVGKAVYVFAYYEWTIIWIVELMQNGFVNAYSRGAPMTSGAVRQKLQALINDSSTDFTKISKTELQACCDEFESLIVRRNALIHAHPCTDSDGSQILSYQSKTTKPLPDMHWPSSEVEAIVSKIDHAACNAGTLLDKLR